MPDGIAPGATRLENPVELPKVLLEPPAWHIWDGSLVFPIGYVCQTAFFDVPAAKTWPNTPEGYMQFIRELDNSEKVTVGDFEAQFIASCLEREAQYGSVRFSEKQAAIVKKDDFQIRRQTVNCILPESTRRALGIEPDWQARAVLDELRAHFPARDYSAPLGERPLVPPGVSQVGRGAVIDIRNPDPSQIDILDISHALAHQCRYAGHCERFYSVAEHSVLVSLQVPPEYAFTALMHDATEAYLVDLPRPIKLLLPDYVRLEDNLWRAIARTFPGLPDKLPSAVKAADTAVLAAEQTRVMHP